MATQPPVDTAFSHIQAIVDLVDDQTATYRARMARVTDDLQARGITYEEAVNEFRRHFISAVLSEENGNQCRAARRLKMHRNTLARTLDELKINVAEFVRYTSRRRKKVLDAPGGKA